MHNQAKNDAWIAEFFVGSWQFVFIFGKETSSIKN